jgi:hypothetical protein
MQFNGKIISWKYLGASTVRRTKEYLLSTPAASRGKKLDCAIISFEEKCKKKKALQRIKELEKTTELGGPRLRNLSKGSNSALENNSDSTTTILSKIFNFSTE